PPVPRSPQRGPRAGRDRGAQRAPRLRSTLHCRRQLPRPESVRVSGMTMRMKSPQELRAEFIERVSHVSLDPNPALADHAKQRAASVQNRIADQITAFAGSMWFVYIHIIWFSCWIGLGVEKYPYGLLTMIVSLEAIFLSTFVMISQNRADAKRQ